MDTKSTTIAALRAQIAELEQRIRDVIREDDVEAETAPEIIQGGVMRDWL